MTLAELAAKYVNLNLVRTMIAQHALGLVIASVIIIYLVYYFRTISKVSSGIFGPDQTDSTRFAWISPTNHKARRPKRPKLVGQRDSAFVQLIRRNFKQSLERRFSPLVYFWGTNPQTALFGYLQGQTSDREVPRHKFKRQYLFVSDAQYLASNVDLSEHYERCLKADGGSKRRQSQASTQIYHHRLVHQLDAGQLLANYSQLNSQPEGHPSECRKQRQQTLLKQNIRLVLGNQIDWIASRAANSEAAAAAAADRKESGVEMAGEDEEDEYEVQVGVGAQFRELSRCSQEQRMKIFGRTASSDSSALGSSSDSGVFASETGNPTFYSGSCSSSGSSLTINMEAAEQHQQHQQQQQQDKTGESNRAQLGDSKRCSCAAPYEAAEPHTFSADSHQQQSRRGDLPDKRPLFEPGHEQQCGSAAVKREQLEFGQCALDWYQDSHEHYHRNRQVALISAGMTTGSDKKYVTDTVQTLDRLGYEVCVFIRRGVGGLKLSSTKFFSPSKWRDFEVAILSIKKQRPGARLVAIGFSFGSIELCRYLSMSGEQSLVDSALLISCPFDPEAGGRNMRKRALNRKIDAYLAKNLGKQLYQALAFERTEVQHVDHCDELAAPLETVTTSGGDSDTDERQGKISSVGEKLRPDEQHGHCSSKQKLHYNYNGSVVDLSSLPKIKSLVDFEDNYNRVLQNYPDSDAYAADSRLTGQLRNIKTPTLCLSSEDDFMAPIKLLPIKQIEENENLCMILTKRGGHMAFIDGILWPRRPYFAQRIIEKYMTLDTSAVTKQRQSIATTTTTTIAMKSSPNSASSSPNSRSSSAANKKMTTKLASHPMRRSLHKSASSSSCSSTKSSITTHSTACFSPSSSSPSSRITSSSSSSVSQSS